MTISALSKVAVGDVGITDRSAAEIGRDFMTLLVAQLRMQDPLEPLSGAEFMGQLVQLQSLAELTQIRTALGELAGAQPLGPAVALVGRSVEWLDPVTGQRLSGTVRRLQLQSDGSCALVVGEGQVPLRQVVAVS